MNHRRSPRSRFLAWTAFLVGLAALLAPGGACSRPRQDGRPVPGQVRRVICMSPAYTEICFALGQGNRLVGVTDFCSYPPEVERLTRIGGFLNPDLELIVRLKPDLVLTAPEQPELRKSLNQLGIATLEVPVHNFAEIRAGIRTIARALQAEPAGEALVRAFAQGVGALPLPPGARRPRVLLVVGRTIGDLSGVYVAGRGTFLSEVLASAGGENAYEGAILYPNLSLEGIASLNPDVILELRPGESLSPEARVQAVEDWKQLPFVGAVKNGRVFLLTDSCIDIPGPRAPQTVRIFHETLFGK